MEEVQVLVAQVEQVVAVEVQLQQVVMEEMEQLIEVEEEVVDQRNQHLLLQEMVVQEW